MKKAIIGRKVGMTQIFDETGKVIPVTVIEAGPCTVTAKMTEEKEGYNAVQFGFEETAEKKLSKPEQGHLKKAGVAMVKHLKEFRLEDTKIFEIGDVVKADIFAEGEKVDVTGISKGHGYAGVIKRYGQGRSSMGSSADPSRIMPGKKQAGHMGVDQVTVQNLDVVKVDPELNLIAIRGAIPGPKGGIVYIKSTAKTQIVKKTEGTAVSVNPQKASARVNPQKASARTK